MPPPAKAALSTFLISSSAMTVEELAARAQARIDEINATAATVLALPEVQFALGQLQVRAAAAAAALG